MCFRKKLTVLISQRPPKNNSHWENINTQETTHQRAGKTHSQGIGPQNMTPLEHVFGSWSLHHPLQVSALDHVSPAKMTKSCHNLVSEMGCRKRCHKGGIRWNLVEVLSSFDF